MLIRVACLCRYRTLFFALQEEHRPLVCESEMLKKIVASKRETVTGELLGRLEAEE